MRVFFAFLLLVFTVVAATAQTADRAQQALKTSQAALGQPLPEAVLTDPQGAPVSLASFRGKPLLITLVYTSCADVCPTLIESLYPAVQEAQSALGTGSFSTVTIGFDVRNDTPERMRLLARERGVDLPNWQFLAADQENLDAIARAVGFAIYSRPGGYDHLAQVSVVDKDGKLYQQVYGAVFEPPVIVEPLKDLVFGRYRPLANFQGIIDRIKLFCTVYDPNSGRYYFDYSLFAGIAIGLFCLGLVLTVLVREWRRPPPGTPGTA
ncbi:MAG: SCO family protein [Hyphomicrobiaceae bacterium]|nr:SCO family protein [Hyphomicrobiaceae bacterium]